MKTGLVLEGGAMRGLYTAGVLDVLMEEGIRFDGIVGVSAGACFGCNVKSHQIGRVVRYNKRFCKDPRYTGIRSLIKTGDLIGAEFCYVEVPEKLDLFDFDVFRKDPTPFYVVATDVNTGKAIYHLCEDSDKDIIQWIRASASMPLVSRVVKLQGYELLDGGISDSIPLAFFQSIGYKKNLVVLTQPKSYVKKRSSSLVLMKWMMRKYPAVYKAMCNRHLVYNQQVSYVQDSVSKGETFVIQPSISLPIGRIDHNPETIQLVYDMGRKDALENLEALKRFLSVSI